MICPRCGDEFEAHVRRCPDCDVPLVDGPSSVHPAPRADALLGRFHPQVADLLEALLEQRGVTYERFDLDDQAELLVDRDHRQDLRAELVVDWPGLVGRLPEETMYEVLAAGGQLPGWHDAPEGAWVDRQGRLQVGEAAEHEAEADAHRRLGPTLVAVGVVVALFGWYVGTDGATILVVLGLGTAGVGLFLPR